MAVAIKKHAGVDFDAHAPRCFMLEEVPKVTEAKIKTENIFVIKKVFNLVMTDPTGKQGVLIVWGHNAERVRKIIKYVYFTI